MNWNHPIEGCVRAYLFLGAVCHLVVESPAGTKPEWLKRKSQTETFTSPGLTVNSLSRMMGRTGAPRNLPRPVRAARVRKET